VDTPYVDITGDRELRGDARGEDRAVGAGIMLAPSQLQSSPLGFQD
jgi:hypothetical protein